MKDEDVPCPNCGGKLVNSQPDIILLSHPPKIHVHCENCGYSGYKWVLTHGKIHGEIHPV